MHDAVHTLFSLGFQSGKVINERQNKYFLDLNLSRSILFSLRKHHVRYPMLRLSVLHYNGGTEQGSFLRLTAMLRRITSEGPKVYGGKPRKRYHFWRDQRSEAEATAEFVRDFRWMQRTAAKPSFRTASGFVGAAKRMGFENG